MKKIMKFRQKTITVLSPKEIDSTIFPSLDCFKIVLRSWEDIEEAIKSNSTIYCTEWEDANGCERKNYYLLISKEIVFKYAKKAELL